MASIASVSGLASGVDSASLISQLMQVEARPQTLLKQQLSKTQTVAAAYRDINSAFAGLVTAAKAVTGSGLTSARTATSTSASVTATATATATPGSSVTFTVTALAAPQTAVSNSEWASPTTDVRTQSPSWPITILGANGTAKGTIDVPAGATLSDAADAINKSNYGLTATVVQLAPNRYRLQVSSSATGAASKFTIQGANETATTAGSSFLTSSTAQDATLNLGGGLVASSSSNTFAQLLTGVSVTVSSVTAGAANPNVTVSVASDTDAVTKKLQGMVDAANAVLSKISRYTDTSTGSAAALKGDYPMSSLAGEVLNAVSYAVGANGSAAAAGLQLTKDGQLAFDSSAFKAKLASDPALVQRLLGGTLGPGVDNVAGTADDTIATDGVAARLQRIGQRANDSVAGTLTLVAKSQDTRSKELQKQIDDWDLRLALRQETLTAQFTAMETALGALKSQSSWLAGQIAQLPSPSKS